MAKAMKDYKYNFGLKLRIYPDYQQRKIIKMSSDASRFVYNEMVYLNLELWKFRNPKIYIAGVTEKIKLFLSLTLRLVSTLCLTRFLNLMSLKLEWKQPIIIGLPFTAFL